MCTSNRFRTSGSILNAEQIKSLLEKNEIKYLGELMNYPGVLADDSEVMSKIEYAKELNKTIDGHAPGLRGEELKKYIAAGISTDHECTEIDEAREKLENGMKVIIREGSAAKNFDALIPLMKENPEMLMFCSDDKHPDDLLNGHINGLVKRAVKTGYDLFDILRAASLNPIEHYKLHTGLLRQGDSADFIIVDSLTEFNVLKTIIKGHICAVKGESSIERITPKRVNKFSIDELDINELKVIVKYTDHVIGVIDKSLFTEHLTHKQCSGDLMKLVVVNRYNPAEPSVAYVHGFGFADGALASSVAHDSHNIIAAGTNDEDIINAINLIIEQKGGISAYSTGMGISKVMPLPVAGLMTDTDYRTAADQYAEMDNIARQMGSKLTAPYMSLSFLALPVIPKLKLTDKGLFNAESFNFVE